MCELYLDFAFLHNLRGCYINSRIKHAYVNLSATQWKGLSEEFLINSICETVVHESCHYAIGELNMELYNYADGEEYAVRVLSGQELDLSGLKNEPIVL